MKKLLLLLFVSGFMFSCQKEDMKPVSNTQVDMLKFSSKEEFLHFAKAKIQEDEDLTPLLSDSYNIEEAVIKQNEQRIKLIQEHKFHKLDKLNRFRSLYDNYQLLISYKAMGDHRFENLYENIKKFVVEVEVKGFKQYHLSMPVDISKALDINGAVVIGNDIYMYDPTFEKVIYNARQDLINDVFEMEAEASTEKYSITRLEPLTKNKAQSTTPLPGRECFKNSGNWYITMDLRVGKTCQPSGSLLDHQIRFGSTGYSWLLIGGNLFPYTISALAVVFDAPGTFITGTYRLCTFPTCPTLSSNVNGGNVVVNTNLTYAEGAVPRSNATDCGEINSLGISNHTILYSGVMGSSKLDAMWSNGASCPLP